VAIEQALLADLLSTTSAAFLLGTRRRYLPVRDGQKAAVEPGLEVAGRGLVRETSRAAGR
jgi:hypothetical protein